MYATLSRFSGDDSGAVTIVTAVISVDAKLTSNFTNIADKP